MEAADAVEAAHGQPDAVCRVGHFRFAGVDADELAAAVIGKMADGGDVRSGADFDANETLGHRQPLLQTLVLQRRAPLHPAPVAEHQDVGPGQGAAVRAMG